MLGAKTEISKLKTKNRKKEAQGEIENYSQFNLVPSIDPMKPRFESPQVLIFSPRRCKIDYSIASFW